jgi:hypothetical protein
MSRAIRTLLAVTLLGCASFARAETLRLVSPASGATLRGGSTAELRWSASELPPRAEEWEAFLSVNGGRYYAFRVTPHLDIRLRRFTFVVPNVEAADARILIRAGDEEHETEFAPRGSFAIVRDPDAEVVIPRLLDDEGGESAREGDEEVVSWTDGPRDGVGTTQHVSVPRQPPRLQSLIALERERQASLAPSATEIAAPAVDRTVRASRASRARRPERRPLVTDLLLVCRRRNI